MDEHKIRALVDQVRCKTLGRRAFIQRMVSAGLSAPMASMLLMHEGIAQQPEPQPYKPARRGAGGALRLIWWQAPTLLQPHFAIGLKDQEASRIFYEPLANWDDAANLVPVLADAIPTRDNGGVSSDATSIVWRLKRGVTWHDGRPFTADDVVFTWEFARHPGAASVTGALYGSVTVSKIDTHAVRLTFAKPTPFWAGPFVSSTGMIIPKHIFEPYLGNRAREAPANLRPVGTGPYRLVDFKPGDLIRGEANPAYHMPDRPYFDTIEVKGGGDPTSAARAVLQTGEYDHATFLQVDDELLRRMEESGKGRARFLWGNSVEMLLLNMSDPWHEVDGERASPRSRHFCFSDPRVREAMALLVDRPSLEKFVFGRGSAATPNFLTSPEQYRSRNTSMLFDIEKANALLDAAGWHKGADGIREKSGRKMSLVFQTSTSSLRQKSQAVIKQSARAAGIDIELKSVPASVFFSSDMANPDTFGKFWCDMQMFATSTAQPDPVRQMGQFRSEEIAQKSNRWLGRNSCRWSSPAYDKAFAEADAELDAVKRAALFIRMNDILVQDHAVIPLLARTRVVAVAKSLVAAISVWDLDMAYLQDWHREG